MAPGVPTASAGWAVPPAPPCMPPPLLPLSREALGANGVRYVDARRPVRRVAVGAALAPTCCGMPWPWGATPLSPPT
ncbi:hypothetical protein M5E87_22180 [Flavonifractor plautii]|nr:hypothetical protein M5E87_22180 [Flavonifractor plautii]